MGNQAQWQRNITGIRRLAYLWTLWILSSFSLSQCNFHTQTERGKRLWVTMFHLLIPLKQGLCNSQCMILSSFSNMMKLRFLRIWKQWHTFLLNSEILWAQSLTSTESFCSGHASREKVGKSGAVTNIKTQQAVLLQVSNLAAQLQLVWFEWTNSIQCQVGKGVSTQGQTAIHAKRVGAGSPLGAQRSL